MNLLNLFIDLCEHFGIPLAKEKTVLPTTCLEFLGITIDTGNMEFCLPRDKLDNISELLINSIRKKKILLKDMQKLLGSLAFVTRILPVGRIFPRRLYFSIAGFKSPYSHIRMSIRRAILQYEFISDRDFCLSTDSAGSVGFAATSLVC